MGDMHIGKRGSEAAGEEQLDKLRKTARFEPEASSASGSPDPIVTLEHLASGERESRLESVLVLKSGHVGDDVHISALDPFCKMEGRIVAWEKCWSGIEKKMPEILRKLN